MKADPFVKKPSWLKIKMPGGPEYSEVKRTLKDLKLHTVCEEARCPNLGECWGLGTATFMILGDKCTRGCRFCAVERCVESDFSAIEEPERIKTAAVRLSLSYVVITSVTRDDLFDGGSSVFALTIRELKSIFPKPPRVEVLIPDYIGNMLYEVLDASPDVLAHNIETVERLTPVLRHPKFSFKRSLEVLRQSKEYRKDIYTKSSIMLGLGENDDELKAAMDSLLNVGVDILVLGQYLRPSKTNAMVEDYASIDLFRTYEEKAKSMGFGYVVSHPLARTSHHAKQALEAILKNNI